MAQPNILWICTDRQRHDTLGCYGNDWVRTPHLDSLANNGALFEQPWAQCSICAPSRSSFLTGRYPRTAGVNRNGQRIPRDQKLISRLLADGGYVCGHAGKFHLGPSCPGIADWCEPRTDDGYSVFDWSMHPPATPICQYTAWLSEHNIPFTREPVGDNKYIEYGMSPETSNTGWVTQRAINFIRCNEQLKRPWFFSMNLNTPHNPFDPPREYLEPYLKRLDEIPLPHYTPGELDDKPAFQRTDRAGAWGGGGGYFASEKMTDKDHRLIKGAYWALCDHVDFHVGRVLAALRESKQLDNTIIIFISDHGEMLGDHGFYFQGPYFYEEMLRVPLIISWPNGITKSVRVPAFVELVDLAPTLLDAANLPRYGGMQGKSLFPIMTGKADPTQHREDVYAEYYQAIPNSHKPTDGAFLTGVRTKQFALTAVHNHDTGELYDLEKDPTETRNLWNDPAYLTAKAQMLHRLCDRMAATIDPLPLVEGPY